MGGQVTTSKLANYGMNVGPMAVTWLMRFDHHWKQGDEEKHYQANAHQRQQRKQSPAKPINRNQLKVVQLRR